MLEEHSKNLKSTRLWLGVIYARHGCILKISFFYLNCDSHSTSIHPIYNSNTTANYEQLLDEVFVISGIIKVEAIKCHQSKTKAEAVNYPRP